jgi:hypothetical protein
MRLPIKGKKLQQLLHDQLGRVLNKRDELDEYMDRHMEAHRKEKDPNCAQLAQARYLDISIENHNRRLTAMISVLDPEETYRVEVTDFIKNYVDSPFDVVIIPEDSGSEIPDIKLNLN